ncbi:hypothetical protein [Nocardia lijiangensis]|uniref:hypothetical protein n=1 Tax=Nocardia lijiangensis TaxID=299618 RepID=UPI003D738B46
MRARDVRIGELYVVEVPHRLPARAARVRAGEWELWRLRGCRFRAVVTALDTTVQPAAVEALRVTRHSITRVDLSADQCAALGLPDGRYHLLGMIFDDDGHPIELPDLEPIRASVRWLYPVAEQRPPGTHRDIDFHPAL